MAAQDTTMPGPASHSSLFDIPHAAPSPRAPATIEETGLAPDQLSQLLVKTLYGGEASGLTIADRLRLPFAMLEPLVEHLRAEHLMEVRGATGSGTAGYRFALTDLGRDRARQYLDANAYVGPAPVPLAVYVDAMQNARGKTIAAPYSARARPNATVSMPLNWKQIEKGEKIADFTIKNVPKLVEKNGDAWAEFFDGRQELKLTT